MMSANLVRIGVAIAIAVSGASPALANCPLISTANYDVAKTLAPSRAQAAWESCLEDAADRLSPQPEAAGPVVNEAFAECSPYERAVRREIGEENCLPGYGFIGPLRKQDLEPRIFARVMAWRAARMGRGSHR